MLGLHAVAFGVMTIISAILIFEVLHMSLLAFHNGEIGMSGFLACSSVVFIGLTYILAQITYQNFQLFVLMR